MPPRRLVSILVLLALTAGGIVAWRKYSRRDRGNTRPAKTEKVIEELSRITAETRSVEVLARTLREFIRWRAGKPDASREEIAAEMLRRLEEVPHADLPADCAALFTQLRAAWAARAAGSTDPATTRSGQEASAALQKLLSARGYADIRL